MIRLTIGETVEVQLGRRTRLRLVPRFAKLYLVVFETFIFDTTTKQEEPNGFKVGDEDRDGWRSISYRRGRFWGHIIIGKREPWFIRVSKETERRTQT